MASTGSGFTTIPASRRPDGTWRKERKVKEGYVPPDEVERYQSKGKKWAEEMPKLPPGVHEDTQSQPTKLTKNQKKNERKKQKRKEKAEEEHKEGDKSKGLDPGDSISSGIATLDVGSKARDHAISDSGNNSGAGKDEKGKRIKALCKKIKQIEELERKLKNGELKSLEKDQEEKIKKKQLFLDELCDLESS